MRLEFLVEEQSMKDFLEILLPTVLPKGLQLRENAFIRPHQGKQDLQKSIPKKVRAFSHENIPVYIVVIHDQDSNDCIRLKSDLISLCNQGNCPFLVRIVCIELESWYMGDVDALGKLYRNFNPNKHRQKKHFKNPDLCQSSDELKKIIGSSFSKGYTAKNIASLLTIKDNKSKSFQSFITGLNKFLSNHGLNQR